MHFGVPGKSTHKRSFLKHSDNSRREIPGFHIQPALAVQRALVFEICFTNDTLYFFQRDIIYIKEMVL